MAFFDLLTTKQTFLDAQGNPASGHRLWIKIANTTGAGNNKTTFREADGTAANTNPIILDSRGELPFGVYAASGGAKLIFTTPEDAADPPSSPIWTRDNVAGINDIGQSAFSEWIPFAGTPIFLSAASFTLPGDQTTAFHAGRRVKFTVATGSAYGTILSSLFTTLTTVTMQMTAGALDAGLSAVALGIISAINSSAPDPDLNIDPPARFEYHSPTECRLNRYGGTEILLLSGGLWQQRPIPAAGIVIGNGGLALGTLYYAYAAWSGTAVILELSTTTHIPDPERGVRVKTGDATRRLVGMLRTTIKLAPAEFVYSASQRLVLSYFQRRTRTASNVLPAATATGSTVTIELHTGLRTEFLTWAGESAIIQFTGWGSNSLKGHTMNTTITYDGIVNQLVVIAVFTAEANYTQNLSLGGATELPEGYHYLTIAVSVSSGIGTWNGGSLWCTVRG